LRVVRRGGYHSAILIGRNLEQRYEIIRVIGHGGMGTVYEAADLATGRKVAIKWMHARPFAPDDPDLLRFTQEARIAGSLDSPHVTALVELARDPETDVPFQVMELLSGEDVHTMLERVGPLKPEVALRVSAQACRGLAAAHEAGVVHRDVKPENLFLARTGSGEVVVKVLDFGVAKIRRTAEHTGAGGGLTAPAVSMTQSGQVLGTPLFMAPEQLEGARHVDSRSDVYSMGLVLYALLAGAPPHSKIKSFVQLLHALVNEPLPPLSDAAPWVPEGIVAIVEKALKKDKEKRYPDAQAMLDALLVWLPRGTDLNVEMFVPLDEATKSAIVTRAEPKSRAMTTAVVRVPAKKKGFPREWVVAIVLLSIAMVTAFWAFLRAK